MNEIDIAKSLLDLTREVGVIQGTQSTFTIVIGGIGTVGVMVIGYLGHCLFRLGRELTDLNNKIAQMTGHGNKN